MPHTVTPQPSHVEVNEYAVSYVGPDAVNLLKARMLASSLRLYGNHGIKPTRGVTPTLMLTFASVYSGKTYKRGDYLRAADDVQAWADVMAQALPTTVNGREV